MLAEETRARLRAHKRIVVKIGTTSLTHANGRLNLKRIEKLAWVLTDLHNAGRDVILVSSGAIAVGADRLGLAERPRDVRGKQAASAVGQAVLMQIYENFFMNYNQKVAQILLTKDVFDDPERRALAGDTFDALLSMGVIPIVNENDTVSTAELGFSENDSLSAYVACLLSADALLILSDTDGIYDSDPKRNPDAVFVPFADGVDDALAACAGESAGNLGTGGMFTKMAAVRVATEQGIDTVIASGEEPAILHDILNGEPCGTLIRGQR